MSAPSTRTRPERRVAINSSLLLLAYGFQALVSLAIVGILARYLGQAGLGRYAFIISFIELFTVLVDMGMNRILVREVAKDQRQATRVTSAVWTLRLILALVVFVVVAALAAGETDRYLWLATMAFFVSQVIYLMGDVFAATFQGYQRMEYQFWSIIIAQVTMLALILGVVWLDLGLVALFGARIVANALRLVYVQWTSVHRGFAEAHVMPAVLTGAAVTVRNAPTVIAVWRRSGRAAASALIEAQGERLVKYWSDARLAWYIFVESLPVGISLLLHNYIWRAGVVLTVLWLGEQQGDLVNGALYGPLRAVQQVRIIPAAFAAAMLPVFSNRAANRMAEFDSAFAKTVKLFTAISLLIALAFTFLAEPMVTLLLGETIDLSTAALVLAWLGWVVVLYFPNWLYGVTLVALGRQKLETLGLALGLVAGFVVAWWGIPRYQAMGVVAGILAAEGVFFVVGTFAMRQHFHLRQLAPSLIKVILACGGAGAVFFVGSQVWTGLSAAGRVPAGAWGALLQLAIVGACGLAVFGFALLALRTFNQDEKEAIAIMLRLRRSRP